jgi:hypothetical protein
MANDALVMGVAITQLDVANIHEPNPGLITTNLMFDVLCGKGSIVSRIQQLVIGWISVPRWTTTPHCRAAAGWPTH